MTALRDYVAEMLALCPDLGRKVPVTGLAVGSATSSELATGESSQHFVNEWIWRAWCAAANPGDRYRLITAYTNTSGLLAHSGANYGDTTTTGESMFVLKYEPRLYVNAVQEALTKLKFLDRTEFPTLQSQQRNWIHDLDWVRKPADVDAVMWSNNPVLTRNRGFQKWNSYQATGGGLSPDYWTVETSDSADVTRVDLSRAVNSQQWRGRYGTRLADATASVQQVFPGLYTGITADSLDGVSLTAVAVAIAGAASDWKIALADQSGSETLSAFITNAGWVETTVAATMTTAALSAGMPYIGSSATAPASTLDLAEFYAVETSRMSDAVRRDDFPESAIDYDFDQGSGSLIILGPRVGRGGQFVVYSRRSYPQFDAARVAAGTADADESDAPLRPIAIGALAALFKGLAGSGGGDTTRFKQLAAYYEASFDAENSAHQFKSQSNLIQGARPGRRGPLAPAVR